MVLQLFRCGFENGAWVEGRAVPSIEIAFAEKAIGLKQGMRFGLDVMVGVGRESSVVLNGVSVHEHAGRNQATVDEETMLWRHEQVFERLTGRESMSLYSNRVRFQLPILVLALDDGFLSCPDNFLDTFNTVMEDEDVISGFEVLHGLIAKRRGN